MRTNGVHTLTLFNNIPVNSSVVSILFLEGSHSTNFACKNEHRSNDFFYPPPTPSTKKRRTPKQNRFERITFRFGAAFKFQLVRMMVWKMINFSHCLVWEPCMILCVRGEMFSCIWNCAGIHVVRHERERVQQMTDSVHKIRSTGWLFSNNLTIVARQ